MAHVRCRRLGGRGGCGESRGRRSHGDAVCHTARGPNVPRLQDAVDAPQSATRTVTTCGVDAFLINETGLRGFRTRLRDGTSRV